MVNDVTPNFKLPLPPFNKLTWHNDYYKMAKIIDAVLGKYIAIENLQGVWENSTEYLIGQAIVNPDDSNLYRCQVDHVSSAIPTTFTEELDLHPTYWISDASLSTTVSGALPHYVFSLTSASDFVALGGNQDSKIVDFDFTVDSVFVESRTPIITQELVIDVNKNGSSIFADAKPQIDIGGIWSGDSSVDATPTVTLFPAGSIMSIDVDRVGLASGVKVTVYGRFTG